MDINEYSQLIKNEFLYLFDEYGFNIVYMREKQSRFNVFRIGLQSNVCKILFVREQGAGVSFLGTPSAPFEHEMDEQWVSLISLLSYKLKEDFDWGFLNTIPPDQKIQSSLSFSAKRLKPHCRQLMEMFKSRESMAEWKPAFKQYVREKLHRP